jgi:beta propeller domain-containing protein
MRRRSGGAGRGCASLVSGASFLWLVGCGGEAPGGVTTPEPESSSGGGGPPPLSSPASCDALLDHLHEGLMRQVLARAEQARVAPEPEQSYVSAAFSDGRAAASASIERAALTASSGPPGFPPFSDTTVQVPGVDEGDLVKAEGERIYWIHGSRLYVIDAASPATLQILQEAAIEGDAAELLVHAGKLAVFSRVYGALPGVPVPAASSPYAGVRYTKLTVLDVAAGAAEVLRESYVAGDYAFSRGQGSVVRGVVQYGARIEIDAPNVSYTDIFGRPRTPEQIDRLLQAWVEVSAASIQASTLEDYLPASYERVGGALVERSLRCGDYLVPEPGLSEGGATSVLSLDLDALNEPLENLTVLGYADTIHVDDDAVIVRQTDWLHQPDLTTHLHVFELQGARSRFKASGSVDGMLATPSSLDEVDGVLRLVTTSAHYQELPGGGIEYLGATNLLLTLGVGPTGLTELGRTADFGAGRFIHAARFAGDRAYVTTGPSAYQLEVVDLADPGAPTIAGRLGVPGETYAVLPLAGNRLLAFIQAFSETTFLPLLSLQLLDVQQPSAPELAHEYLYSDYSSALFVGESARAVAFNPSEDLFAFPITSPITVNSLDVFRLSADLGFTRLGGVVTEVVLPTLPECLAHLGYPSDPESLAELERDPERLAAVLEECRSRSETPYAYRGLLRGDDVFSVNNVSLTGHRLNTLAGAALSRVGFPTYIY